jgi:hypothetical protein
MRAGVQMSTEEQEPAAAARALQAELDAQREEFHRELGRRAFRIGELEEEVHRVAETYESSLSWRITRPVRSARTLLARLRRS